MSYHYTREPGEEGSVLTGEGDAAGTDLATLLAMDRPTLRAALEIGSALADILTISEEDGIIHGDIKPGTIRLDATGAVSIEGFGIARRTTRAPEGRPDTVKADVFGLGVVLHSLLSNEPLGMLPRDAEGHDNAVVDRVLAMDFNEVKGKRWLEDVQQFLCKIMAFYPDERPAPLDAANVLAHVAAQCPGQSLAQWAGRAIGHTGGGGGGGRKPGKPIAEDLTGPQMVSGPMAAPVDMKSNTRTAPSAKGESTAFWSKEKIAALLAEQDDDSDELPPAQNTRAPRGAPPPPEPARGGRARPASAPEEDLGGPVQKSWSSPAAGLPPAPPPPAWRDEAPAFSPVSPGLPPDSPSEEFFRGGDAMNAGAPRPARQEPVRGPVATGPSPYAQGPVAQGPTARGPVAQGPVAQGPIAQGPVAQGPVGRGPESAPAGGSKTKWLIIGGVVLVLGCMGIVGAGAVAMFTMRGTETPEDVVEQAAEEPTPAKTTDTAAPKTEPAAVEEPVKEEPKQEAPKKEEPKAPTSTSTGTTSSGSGTRATSSGSTSTGSTSSGSGTRATSSGSTSSGSGTRSTSGGSSTKGGSRSTSTPTPTPTPEPTPMIAAGKIDARITFADPNANVQVSCGDGQTRKFNGTTSMTFEGTQTCRIKAGDAVGVFTASKTGSITCSASGSNISCSGG